MIDGRVLQQTLRDTVLGRKNYLHFGSDAGGERAAVIGSCKLGGIDPRPTCTMCWSASLTIRSTGLTSFGPGGSPSNSDPRDKRLRKRKTWRARRDVGHSVSTHFATVTQA